MYAVLPAALLALVISLIVGRNAMAIGRALGLLDFPDPHGGRKRHARVTPLVGGLAVVLSSLLAAAATLLSADLGPAERQHLTWFIVTVAGLYLIGLADDRFALSPRIRLVLAVGMLALAAIYAPDFSLSFLRFGGQDQVMLLGWWGDAFALLCFVGLLNAVNMADGKNGIVLCLGLIWTIVLAFRLPGVMLPTLAATGVALAVMLWFNLRGELFLGDGGSYAISAMFGLLAVYAYNHGFADMRADDVAVLFAIPVFDTLRLMAVRIAAGNSPFMPDRDHLHHRLHHRWGWPAGLGIYVVLVAVPNFGALALPGTGGVWLFVSALGYVAVMLRSRTPVGVTT